MFRVPTNCQLGTGERRLIAVAPLCLAFLCLSSSAWASEAESKSAPESEAPTATAEGSVDGQLNGLMVVWDENGKVMRVPQSEEMAEITAGLKSWMASAPETVLGPLSAPPGQVKVERLQSGMLKARLPLHLLNFSTVRLDAAGNFNFDCAKGEEHDHDHPAPAAVRPAAEEESR